MDGSRLNPAATLPPPRPRRVTPSWVWAVPNVVLFLFIGVLFGLLLVLQRYENDAQRSALVRDIQWAEQTIRTHLITNQEFLQLLAREIVEGTLDQDNFQIRATQYVANNPDLTNIVWIDADQVVRWAAPFETTTRTSGDKFGAPEQVAAYQRAQQTGLPAYSAPITGAGGEVAIEVYVPVSRNRESLGAIVGVYTAGTLLEHLAPSWFSGKYRLVLEGQYQVLGTNSTIDYETERSDVVYLDPPGHGVRLRVSAYKEESGLGGEMQILLIVGLAMLMVWSLWALTAHVRRRQQAERERDRLFNLSLDILCIVGLDGSMVRANPAFERVLGYGPDDQRGKTIFDFVHPDDMAATMDEVRKLARGEPSINFENRYRCADGSYKWLEWNVNPVIEEQLLYAVAHDITERKRTEEAMRTEYAFRKAMEESVTTGLRAVDMEGRIIYVNPAFCDMVGWSAQELIGTKPPFPYWDDDNLERIWQLWEQTLRGEIPRTGVETHIKRKNGERVDARMFISPLIDADGRQMGWMGSMVDITEPKRARAELEASHQRFVAVLEGLDAAVCVADVHNDEILFANRAFKSIYGFDAIGRRDADVAGACRPNPAALLADPRKLAADELPRELFDGELRNSQNGHWYHLRVRAIRWVDGRVVRMEIATDITDRKLAEEVSLQQQERLEQTSRLITMGEMASSLAHELNQPLSAIANYCMGSVNRLQSGEYRPEDLLAAMQKASFQAERAGKIIRRMREFVRKSEPNRAPVRLADIMEEAMGFADIEARKAGVAIKLDLPGDLPCVYADKIMIEQVMLNLVKNGIEAMHETAAEDRQVAVSAGLNGGSMIEVAVADRGHGIDPEQADKLFSPFYTTKTEGMGMGLNICRSIIEFHGGRLWAQPNAPRGSVFRFTLPVEG